MGEVGERGGGTCLVCGQLVIVGAEGEAAGVVCKVYLVHDAVQPRPRAEWKLPQQIYLFLSLTII